MFAVRFRDKVVGCSFDYFEDADTPRFHAILALKHRKNWPTLSRIFMIRGKHRRFQPTILRNWNTTKCHSCQKMCLEELSATIHLIGDKKRAPKEKAAIIQKANEKWKSPKQENVM